MARSGLSCQCNVNWWTLLFNHYITLCIQITYLVVCVLNSFFILLGKWVATHTAPLTSAKIGTSKIAARTLTATLVASLTVTNKIREHFACCWTFKINTNHFLLFLPTTPNRRHELFISICCSHPNPRLPRYSLHLIFEDIFTGREFSQWLVSGVR